MLLARPDDGWQTGAETVNDADSYLSNFWRALAADPEQVAHYADWPVNECVPAGTMISTPTGERPIESLKAGDAVLGYAEGHLVDTRVVAISKNESLILCELGELRLTPNHPVWTSGGYICASDLHPGHVAAILAYERNRPRVDYLRIGRSQNGSNSICGSDISRTQQKGNRAFIEGEKGSQDASGLLDLVIDSTQLKAVNYGYRAECGGRLAGSGAFLDCSLPDLWKLGQPYGRWRRYAGIETNSGTGRKAEGKDDWTQISSRPSFGNAWQASHARSRGENSGGFNWSHAFVGNLPENSASGQGQGYELLHYSLSSGSHRSSAIGGSQGEDCGQNHKPKIGRVYENRGNISVNHGSGTMFGGFGNIHQPIHTKGMLLQGPTIQLSAPITVFNIQTTSGNYFANRVLVHNCDLVARHLWLVNTGRERIAKMESDPDFFDAKVAGWWVWGINSWIGSGWCSGTGPHKLIDGVVSDDRKLPHLGTAGQGVNRKLPHLGDAGRGVNRQLPHLGTAGRGVNRQLPHLGNRDKGGQLSPNPELQEYFLALSERLRRVRVCCGDWSRVVTTGALSFGDTVGIFLDPPYLGDVRAKDLYRVDDHNISNSVREWAIANGDNSRYRIVMCGYFTEHMFPDSWKLVRYTANRCYGTAKGKDSANTTNRGLECLWLSPHCVSDKQPQLNL